MKSQNINNQTHKHWAHQTQDHGTGIMRQWKQNSIKNTGEQKLQK